MGRKSLWGEVENKYIEENVGKLRDSDLAQGLTKLIGREVSVQSVRKQRQKLGLLKKSGRGKCELKEGVTQRAAHPNNPSIVEAAWEDNGGAVVGDSE